MFGSGIGGLSRSFEQEVMAIVSSAAMGTRGLVNDFISEFFVKIRCSLIQKCNAPLHIWLDRFRMWRLLLEIDQFEEIVLFPAADVDLIPIFHDDPAAVATQIALYIVKVDQVHVVDAAEAVGNQHLFELLELFGYEEGWTRR